MATSLLLLHGVMATILHGVMIDSLLLLYRVHVIRSARGPGNLDWDQLHRSALRLRVL